MSNVQRENYNHGKVKYFQVPVPCSLPLHKGKNFGMVLIVFSPHLCQADSSAQWAKEATHVCTQIQIKTVTSISRIPEFKLLYESKLSLKSIYTSVLW